MSLLLKTAIEIRERIQGDIPLLVVTKLPVERPKRGQRYLSRTGKASLIKEEFMPIIQDLVSLGLYNGGSAILALAERAVLVQTIWVGEELSWINVAGTYTAPPPDQETAKPDPKVWFSLAEVTTPLAWSEMLRQLKSSGDISLGGALTCKVADHHVLMHEMADSLNRTYTMVVS